MSKSLFTEKTTARIVGLVRAGTGIEDACDAAGVARSTFQGWMRKGARATDRAEGSAYARFRQDIERARGASADETLTQEQLVRLMEAQAKQGSVRAIQLLLERPWERKRDGDDDAAKPADPFAEADELAKKRERRTA